MTTQYDINAENLKRSLSTISSDYSFTHFTPPASNQLSRTNLNMCYAGKNDPTINMTDINLYLNGPTVYHSESSCKMNAALLQSKRIMTDQQKIYSKTLENGLKKQGLNFNIVDGYYLGNAKHFLGKTIRHSGLAREFNDKNNATNQLITDPNYLKYSVEWYGFFCPSVTGLWTFTINSTNKSLLWVGDIAVNDYDAINSLVDSQSRRIGRSRLLKNRYYPIRIQYGNRTSTDIFSIGITGPNSQEGIPLLYTLYNDDGKLFEKALTYYSLIESSPEQTAKGLYSCYVTNSDPDTYDQLKKRTAAFIEDTVWSLLNEATEDNKLDAFNYLFIDSAGIISLYDSAGNILKSLSGSDGKPIKSTGNMKLGDDGILQVEVLGSQGTYTAVSQSKSGLETPEANSNWGRYKTLNQITNPYKLQSQLSAASTPILLVSNNNQYNLSITDFGNLVIYQSINACTSTDKLTNHYTPLETDSNSRFLYRINADEKISNLFLENKKSKTLLPVDLNSTNITLLKGNYTPYSGYYNVDSGSSIKTKEECQKECDDNANCSYYYYNTKDSSCKVNNAQNIDKSTFLPKTFIPNQNPQTGQDSTSTLYLRNINMKLIDSDARKPINTVPTTDYNSYSEHILLMDKNFILSDDKPKTNNIGYNGLATPLRNQLITNWNYINGKGEPRNQPAVIQESFDTHNYQTGTDTRNIGGNPGSNKNLPNEIIDRQINPMMDVAKDYAVLQKQINDKYYSIDDKLNKVTNDNKNGIRDILSDDPKEIYDFSGNTFYYNSKKLKKVDALKDDVQIMLVQTNDMFILGSLTIATLLVAAIYFGKE